MPRPRLVVHEAGSRRVVPVDKPVFRIGRGVGADLQLTAADVSREHAVIITDGDGYLLRDRSRAGTFVNGEPITERRLAHGDDIECGRSGAVLMFVVDTAAEREGLRHSTDLRPIAELLESLRAMGGERVLDEVLALVIDAAIQESGAERGFIMLADAAGRLEMQMGRAAGRLTLPRGENAISRKIPDQVFESGEAMVVADLLEGGLATVHTGTVALGIRQVLCVPLRVVRYVERSSSPGSLRNIGVLYLDSRARGRLLSDTAREAIEALAGEAALAIENARLYQEAVEKARIDRELATASRIQQALLPEPRRAGPFFEAVGASIPSRSIGGDFFDYQDLADGAFGLAIGDITGKGPPAALLTALVQGLLAAESFTSSKPEEVIALINRVLLARPIESRFLSLFLSVLSPDGRLEYCNGGQNPPLLFSHLSGPAEAGHYAHLSGPAEAGHYAHLSGPAEAGHYADPRSARLQPGHDHQVTRLEIGGTLIGAFPQAVFERGVVQLADGDTLVLYSDGVSEAENLAGDEFGEAGIRATVAAAIAGSPQQVLDALFDALRTFTHGTGPHDDMTAVVVRYR